jgi:flagellar hook-length control protein FliK
MNVESANLSSLASNAGTVIGQSVGTVMASSASATEGVSPPLTDGSIVSEGFSGALVTQIELISNIKTGDSLTLQTPVQDVSGLPVGKVDKQDFAALLGNNLPSSYQTKGDVSHEAALGVVTDALKYIAMGTTAGEKAAKAEQNKKDVIAMAVPVEQNMKDVVAVAVSVEQNMKDVVAVAVPGEQNTTYVTAGVEQSMKNVVVMGAPVQMDLKQTSDKSVKKRIEDEAQRVEGSGRITEALLAVVVPPAVMPTEQGKVVNNLTPADAIKEDGVLSFIKPPAGDAKSNQSAKVSGDMLQSETVFRQPDQDKQGVNLKYFESAGKTEKTVRVEGQALGLEGEKTLPRVGADITQLNRPIVDNKAEVPAMTKPLSHPEWNKDLGERIVWMNSRAIPAAEIRMNPQHLGPISVRVDVADDQATVVFTAQHAAVRDALEASIPKLREMMNAQQLNLAEVTISQGSASDQGRSQSQSFAQGFAEGRGQGTVPGTAVDGVDDVEQEIESGRAVVSKGLLSIYA